MKNSENPFGKQAVCHICPNRTEEGKCEVVSIADKIAQQRAIFRGIEEGGNGLLQALDRYLSGALFMHDYMKYRNPFVKILCSLPTDNLPKAYRTRDGEEHVDTIEILRVARDIADDPRSGIDPLEQGEERV